MGQPGRDAVEDGANEAVVPSGVGEHRLLVSGWMESHAEPSARGPHLAIRQAGRDGGAPLVVHLDQVPALVAAMTEVARRMTMVWERDGASYWASHDELGVRGENPAAPAPSET